MVSYIIGHSMETFMELCGGLHGGPGRLRGGLHGGSEEVSMEVRGGLYGAP